MKNIGFIGVGYMGYGIAKNILKHKNKLFVIANKNRKPIEKIVNDGAEEVKSFEDFTDKNLDALFMCVTNTPIAKSSKDFTSSAPSLIIFSIGFLFLFAITKSLFLCFKIFLAIP